MPGNQFKELSRFFHLSLVAVQLHHSRFSCYTFSHVFLFVLVLVLELVQVPGICACTSTFLDVFYLLVSSVDLFQTPKMF